MKPCQTWLLCSLLAFAGCASPTLRMQSPEDSTSAKTHTRLVGEVARPFGYNYVKVEAASLVVGLDGTGEDPAPSPYRSAVLHELQTMRVKNPNQLLASENTTLVLVRGFLPPGVRKGDRFDLEVQIPPRSETKSLRDGWLIETKLTDLAILGGQVREGHTWGIGQGPVLVDPSASLDHDSAELVRGLVLGGGVAQKSRDIALRIPTEKKSGRLSGQIGAAINRRLHLVSHGTKQGVANPRTDEQIDLVIHPRYKDNIARYIRMLQAIPINETPAEQSLRIKLLENQLHDPSIAAEAAIRLEAIGNASIPALVKGIADRDPKVRFYSAEALAYLDDDRAAVPLAQIARDEPDFRAHALAALSTMDDMSAHQGLLALLETKSVETRYGAFRALWTMKPDDPIIRGENLEAQFHYHVLNTSGPPMVHVTRSLRPEVVLFGQEQRLQTPFVLEAGKSILVKGAGDRVTVSKFGVGEPDQKRLVSTKLDEVIRTIVELGGTYPDVVQALTQAETSRALTSKFAVDAMPDGNRPIRERKAADAKDKLSGIEPIENNSPLPEMFSRKQSTR